MGMSAGGGGGVGANINVTPLIDVLLVLLIIFMVIVPTTPKGLEALVPQPPKDPNKQQNPNDRTIVVQARKSGSTVAYMINETSFPKQEITGELQKIFSTRTEKVMFVKGDPQLDFGPIAGIIGMGHAADVTNIGIMTPQVEAGH